MVEQNRRPDAGDRVNAGTNRIAQWFVLFRKEMLESVRNYKALWLPAVFLLLGVMQPVVSYYLPDILAGAGGLPEGAVIEIPLPTAPEVLAETLSQYNTLGALIIALSFMSAISGERAAGTAGLVLVKPVSHGAFVSSKWAAMLAVMFVSFAIGYMGAWYYTSLLIGSVDAGSVLGSLLLYGLWLAFIGTATLLFSALIRSGAGAAFAALGTAAVLSITSGLRPDALAWSPGRLAAHSAALLAEGRLPSGAWAAVIVTAAAIAAMIAAAAAALRRTPSLD